MTKSAFMHTMSSRILSKVHTVNLLRLWKIGLTMGLVGLGWKREKGEKHMKKLLKALLAVVILVAAFYLFVLVSGWL